jgi:hypothetical protein
MFVEDHLFRYLLEVPLVGLWMNLLEAHLVTCPLEAPLEMEDL